MVLADVFCQITVNLFVTVFCSLCVCSCTDTMEMLSNKKRNYDDHDIEPVCRQKRNFPPSYGSKRAMLSVLELSFPAMTMLSHINTQSMERVHTQLISTPSLSLRKDNSQNTVH